MGFTTDPAGFCSRRGDGLHLGPNQQQKSIHVVLVGEGNLDPADLSPARCCRNQGHEIRLLAGIPLQYGFRTLADGNETDRRTGEVQGAPGRVVDLKTHGPPPARTVPVKLRFQPELGHAFHHGLVPLPPGRPQACFDVRIGRRWPCLVTFCSGHVPACSFAPLVASLAGDAMGFARPQKMKAGLSVHVLSGAVHVSGRASSGASCTSTCTGTEGIAGWRVLRVEIFEGGGGTTA